MADRRPKVLMAKIGLDGHDAGLRIVSKALLNAGVEVIYLGIQQTPDAIAFAAIEEDVDLIGLSSLCGAHLNLARQVMTRLEAKGITAVPPVIVGGTIPERDIAVLKALGVEEVFPSGSSVAAIVHFVKRLLPASAG